MAKFSTTLAFISGAAIGAGIALLLAPRSGSETREALQDTVASLAEEGKKKAEEIIRAHASNTGKAKGRKA